MNIIYGIKNTINNKWYVGQTASCLGFPHRKRGHLHKLRNNKHHSAHLQHAWNKYGESVFEWVILEDVECLSELVQREQFWIDEKNSCDDGYNMCPAAGCPLGYKHSEATKRKRSEIMKGRKPWNLGKQTPEHVKEKIRNTLKGRPSPNKGTVASQATRRKMSVSRSGEKNHRSVFTNEQVVRIRLEYATGNVSQRELARIYDVSRGAIRGIVKMRTYKNVK